MKKKGFYSSGEFAKLAHISVRTVRYYDRQNILKPSYVSESGARFYTEQDLVHLQQIMLLKYLGFSLADIRELAAPAADYEYLANSLELQRKLIQDRAEQLQLVESAIENLVSQLREEKQINWSDMLNLIHLTGMESSMKSQYQNSSNISARIRLHHLYSQNKQGWFPWLYDQCEITSGMSILDIGCGDASLWRENLSELPSACRIVLSDSSDGMIREIRRDSEFEGYPFEFETFDCHEIPYEAETFDLVVAGHMLFYCNDIPAVLGEVCRVLKAGGSFVCSTYSASHMREISELVHQFDERIVLSAERLYENFGTENGRGILDPFFSEIRYRKYEDSLEVTLREPLVEYILSCHGNQNQYILEKYGKFCAFVDQKMKDRPFHITKDAGIFLCTFHKNKKST